MLLSEAARTGRKFWRKSEPLLHFILEGKQMVAFDYSEPEPKGQYYEITAEMVVATDWDIEPKSVTITSRDLREAISGLGSKARSPDEVVRYIIEELELDT